ncbi:uncharacterized protein BJ171DRAFT_201892 [Polychytrium aggregatum]|uniref:uncharacterized protein n=1 Tax=Polychytrium aggregatum TaxID=110093 RepID=UPI0022FE1820|nr:uncharacterized protein BJ171DRAFT_201892 [Polychytrium aggregatum]KAI9199731.1 hypothetical protein BJ171DRAFT_201892 [Polychytrium aggregatum]
MEIIDLTDPDFEPSPQVAGLPTGKAADHSQPPSGASLSGLAQVKPDTMAVEPPSAASPVAPASGPLAGGPGSAPDGSGTAGNSSNSNGNGNGIGTTSTSDAMQIDEPRNPVGPPNSTADNNTIGRGNGSSNVTYSNTDQANGSSVAQPPSETAPCLSPLLPGTDYASVRRIQIHLNLADTRKNVFNMDSLLLTDAESNAKISLFAPTRQAPGSGRQLDDDPKDSDDMSVSGAEPDDNRGEADAPKKKRKRRRRQDEEDEYDLDDDFIDDGDLFYDDEDGFVDFDSDPNTAAKIWEYGYFAWKGPIESYL